MRDVTGEYRKSPDVRQEKDGVLLQNALAFFDLRLKVISSESRLKASLLFADGSRDLL
jgi:hypothetical protein